jgi:hypothetical protein
LLPMLPLLPWLPPNLSELYVILWSASLYHPLRTFSKNPSAFSIRDKNPHVVVFGMTCLGYFSYRHRRLARCQCLNDIFALHTGLLLHMGTHDIPLPLFILLNLNAELLQCCCSWVLSPESKQNQPHRQSPRSRSVCLLDRRHLTCADDAVPVSQSSPLWPIRAA